MKYTIYRVKVVNPMPPGEYAFTPQGLSMISELTKGNSKALNRFSVRRPSKQPCSWRRDVSQVTLSLQREC
jgi:hypothetical protein